MSEQLQPGTKVRITVIKQPSRAAAAKTLVRLLQRDPGHRAENRRLAKVTKANYSPSRRGGRLYGGRLVKQHPLQGACGEQGTFALTADLIPDLQSVRSFVSVETL